MMATRKGWLRAVTQSYDADPLPEFRARDEELQLLGDMLELISRLPPERRSASLAYVIERAGLQEEMAARLERLYRGE